jgi:hypothetical protein
LLSALVGKGEPVEVANSSGGTVGVHGDADDANAGLPGLPATGVRDSDFAGDGGLIDVGDLRATKP